MGSDTWQLIGILAAIAGGFLTVTLGVTGWLASTLFNKVTDHVNEKFAEAGKRIDDMVTQTSGIRDVVTDAVRRQAIDEERYGNIMERLVNLEAEQKDINKRILNVLEEMSSLRNTPTPPRRRRTS